VPGTKLAAAAANAFSAGYEPDTGAHAALLAYDEAIFYFAIDRLLSAHHLQRCQQLFAEEIGWFAPAGAEGATAPETLRQKNRMQMTLWRVATL
jgi:hypothetical protein